MAIHRYQGRSGPITNTIQIGNPIWTKCECGKFKVIETGEHIEVKMMNWSDLLELIKCEESE